MILYFSHVTSAFKGFAFIHHLDQVVGDVLVSQGGLETIIFGPGGYGLMGWQGVRGQNGQPLVSLEVEALT